MENILALQFLFTFVPCVAAWKELFLYDLFFAGDDEESSESESDVSESD